MFIDATEEALRLKIKNSLVSGPVRVSFTKKDGTPRDMLCTLSDSQIPEDKKPKSETTVKFSEEAIRVFDLDKQEWRSFRWDSITSVGGI